MTNGFEASKDDFDDMVSKWDQALEKGIFKDAPKPPSTSTHTSQDSFFGFKQDNPTDSIAGSDAEYWRAISSVADGGVEMQRIDEADAVSINLPNPIRKSTEGVDQELKPGPLGMTFSEDDVKKLEEMKIKLHELQDKVAEMGEKKYEDQVKSLLNKIEELSNKMGRVA